MIQEQIDVYFLHLEVLSTNCSAIHPDPDRPQTSPAGSGASPMVDWAIDYRRCMPGDDHDRHLLEKAHQSKERLKLDRRQAGRLGGLLKSFYSKLHEKKLYSTGVRYLGIE